MRYRIGGLLLSLFCGSGFAAAHDPDSDFLQGQALQLSSVGITNAERLIVADDGSFTVSGHCGADYCIAHFLVDGQVDAQFGDNGVLRLPAPNDGTILTAFEYLEDGEVDEDEDGDSDDDDDADDVISHHVRLVLVDPLHSNRLLLARYNSDGQLDVDFDVSADADNDEDDDDTVDEDSDDDSVIDENYDEDGIAELPLAGANLRYEAASTNANGVVILAGSVLLRSGDSHRKVWISRLTTDGWLDTTFYGSGKQILTLTAGGETYTPVVDHVQLDTENRIVLSGHSTDLTHNIGFVLRLDSSGNLDSDFDGDGIRVFYPDNGHITAVQFDLDRDDSVAVVADYVDSQDARLTMRYWLDDKGRDDAAFNDSGSSTLQPGANALTQQRVSWQFDRATLSVGQTGDEQWVLSRFDDEGQLAQSGADVWAAPVADTVRQLAISRAGRFLVLGEKTLQVYTGDRLTPSAWTIAAKTDAERGELVVSEPIAISGLDRTSLVSVEDGAIAVNDEQECDGDLLRYRTHVINNGEFLCVFAYASTDYSDSVAATVRIGADVATFTVTTVEDDEDSDSSGLAAGSLPLSWWWGLMAIVLRFRKRR